MSTTHSSFDQYCISHKTISHQAAAAPGREAVVSAPWHNFQLCPSSQQILATPLLITFTDLCFITVIRFITTVIDVLCFLSRNRRKAVADWDIALHNVTHVESWYQAVKVASKDRRVSTDQLRRVISRLLTNPTDIQYFNISLSSAVGNYGALGGGVLRMCSIKCLQCTFVFREHFLSRRNHLSGI